MPVDDNSEQQVSLEYEISSEAGGQVYLRFKVGNITREEMERLQDALGEIGEVLQYHIELALGEANVELAHFLKPENTDWQILMDQLIRTSSIDEAYVPEKTARLTFMELRIQSSLDKVSEVMERLAGSIKRYARMLYEEL